MNERQEPKNLYAEPPYPDHVTVLWAFGAPWMVHHGESERCGILEPHQMMICGEFE